ncbi:alpha,alpha-trehalose phosphorylase [Carboxydocella sporoproducens DSM 16521]|uniref:Alpha,alpha-trehalose phosphorylase n=2 Tax=Carboxydocella TaxID=178898 RepID=A0A1T4P2X0_9FIRM|nr:MULTISPECIES: beta-phosphoglucomutase [Carboxydocella]AVX19567.1 alpha,alpha-trehalose phosphorylase [Carboxydocella thermautotrophica]SJZ85799.1 alpha,alpha-trehalose phosphorylase [Carboxydocella sporoproducens DSM 16521]
MKQQTATPIYPLDEWKIIEERFRPEDNLRNESIFATGNGYIGMRGNFEEGYEGPEGTSVNGTYLNGFFDSEPIIYGEEAYGYARNRQTMLNVTDGKIMQVLVDDQPFSLFRGRILAYRRELDLKTGLLTREVTWEAPAGQQVRLRFQRLVSLQRKHLAALTCEVEALNFNGEITFISALNGDVRNQVSKGDPRTGSGFQGQVLMTEGKGAEGDFAALRQRTKTTAFALVCAMENAIEASREGKREKVEAEQLVGFRYTLPVKQGEKVRLEKYLAYYTSRDYPEGELLTRAQATVEEARNLGFTALAEEQRQYLAAFWQVADIEIKGDAALQQGLRFNAFQLLQSAGRDGRTNIGAKGLTGEGYEGHYFWDTEIYILPFFLYTSPEIARSLLAYRYHILNKARERARQMSQRGALFPWRTIDGEETSAYYPAGTAQYHINAAVIYALKKYLQATGDLEFFLQAGAEMLFETARFWVDLGDYIPRKGNRFCINGVTGPDEYTAIVNNNAYTNLMAKDHLEFAARMANWLQREYPEQYQVLAAKIGLQPEEVAAWQRAAGLMYLPYDEELGILAQDDSFLDKAVWDFAGTPADKYPLLLHYHPLVIYRHQVLKQADVVLALFLQGNRFSLAEKKRNYDYYEPLTTHDSSLSPCIYSIMAAEIGYKDKAYHYFMQTARLDLDDYHGNVKDGLHMAAMAGARLALVCGFGGMREYDGKLYFNPIIPEKWEGYSFKVRFQHRLLQVQVTAEEAVYTLLTGEPLTIYHRQQELQLLAGRPVAVSIKPRLEAVIFDLDGVITDTAEYHYLAWKRLAEELGLAFDRALNEQLKGIGRKESLEIILQANGKTAAEAEKEEWIARKNRYYLELLEQLTPAAVAPGVLALLQELKAHGIKIALASASKNAPLVLEKLQLTRYFDVIVDAGAVKKGKPDPEIFLTAAEQLQVHGGNCLGIEDAAAGIAAIKAAGMVAVGVGDKATLPAADLVVKTMNELNLSKLQACFTGVR